MKKIFTLLTVLTVTISLSGQAPLSFKYQAVLRDARGSIKANTSVSIIISILQGSATGSVVYSETHAVTTDVYGLINLEIGKGTVNSGIMSGINWDSGTFFVKVTVDDIEMGTSQLLSVPYALYASKAANGFSGNYNDLSNKPILATVSTSGSYNDLTNKPTISNGTVTSVTGTAPVSVATGTSTPVISIVQANGTTDGFLRSTDWTTFNNKSSFDGTWTSLSGKPTTIAGYGITDAGTKAYVDSIKKEIKLEIYAENGVTDIDGNSYKAVKIGSQVWMKENLKATKYNDGSTIPNVTDDITWNGLTTAAYSWYKNDAATYKPAYGALYNWFAVNTGKLCPADWRVPTDGDWHILALAIDPNAQLSATETTLGGKLKESGTLHWASPNGGATNESGFTALPGGTREDNIPGGYDPSSNFEGITIGGCWWTSTEYNTNVAWYRNIGNVNGTLARLAGTNQSKRFGYSVRCLKGEPSLPTISTTAVTSILQSTAVSGGNITSDGGSSVTAKGVCWNTSPDPAISDNKTNEGSGFGSFVSNITGLTTNTTYYLRAYSTNNIGTSYGNQVSFTTSAPFTVTDVDGNVYNTVTIGTQVWMAENLKTIKYNDGTNIPLVPVAWAGLNTPAYCWQNNDEGTNKAIYGAIYNWYTVNTGKLCPTGWHVPSDAEWTVLTTLLGGESTAGGKLKETGTAHWTNPNTGATNETGFTALAGGSRTGESGYGTGFSGTGNNGLWWSATIISGSTVWRRFLTNSNIVVSRDFSYKFDGLSVRCLKD
jgi:uncharacterized protein (TIGR02145 family)